MLYASRSKPISCIELQYEVFTAPRDTPRIVFGEIDFHTPPSVYHPLGGGDEMALNFLMSGEVLRTIADAYRNINFDGLGLYVGGTIKYLTFFEETFITQFIYEMRGMPRYKEFVVGNDGQRPVVEEAAHLLKQAAGRFKAFERVEI